MGCHERFFVEKRLGGRVTRPKQGEQLGSHSDSAGPGIEVEVMRGGWALDVFCK